MWSPRSWAPGWRSPGLRLPEFASAMGLGLGTESLLAKGTQLCRTSALLAMLCSVPSTCGHVVGTHRRLGWMHPEPFEAEFLGGGQGLVGKIPSEPGRDLPEVASSLGESS